jgi:hypothetical protein
MYTRTLTPGGEIRGQLVPIPAAFYLFASGLIGLVGSAGKWKMRMENALGYTSFHLRK